MVKVQEINGVWWFVDPEGRPFVSIGINHIEPILIMGPNNIQRTLDTYGRDFVMSCSPENPKHEDFFPGVDPYIQEYELPYGDICLRGSGLSNWLGKVEKDFRNWKVNTFAYHTSVPLDLVSEDYYIIPLIRCARLEPYFTSTDRYDVFTEEFEQKVRETIKPVCEFYRSKKNVLGYAYTDLPVWDITLANRRIEEDKRSVMHPWVLKLASAGIETPGKKKWMEVLKRRYKSAMDAADVYGLVEDTWEKLEANTEWSKPARSGPAENDSETMIGVIAERWYSLHWSTIRSYDTGHLIFGDKLASSSLTDYILPVLKKYVDVVYIQWYSTYEEQEDTLRRVYSQTGKPVLMGDSAFSVVSPNQDQAKGRHVDSQEEVGKEYSRYLKCLMSLPFAIGWHHCGYIEGSRELAVYDRKFPLVSRQCGFLDPFEKPHEEALRRVIEANGQAEMSHRRSQGS